MKRNLILGLGLGAVLSFGIVTVGCGSSSTDNTASGTGGTSTTMATGGTSTTMATGGAKPVASTGGTTTVAATGGTTTVAATGGTTTVAATGGTTVAATGGTTTVATGGTTTVPTGGTTTVPSGGATTVPGTLCTTQAKGAACTTAGETCNKTCGPNKTGYKSETCTGGQFVEGDCTFPAADYACYKVTTTTAACPTGTKSGDPCTGECTPCSGYVDSKLVPKTGYCVCVKDKLTCGSLKEWPCTTNGTPTTAGGTGCL
jgi:hypothetical protein